MVYDWTVPADLPFPIGREWAEKQTRVVDALDGKLVSIAGYVVPLDLDGTKVKEFLLVPYYGACIHVPPPPPNQIILVKLTHAAEVNTNFEPMVVTGKMHVGRVSTSLADVGYQIAGDELFPYYQ